MSRRRGSGVAVYSPRGTFLRYVGQAEARDLVAGHFAKKTSENSIRLSTLERPGLPTGTTITEYETRANAGEYGSPLEFLGESDPVRRAQEKIAAWPEIYDTKNVVISAGRVHAPESEIPLTDEQLSVSFLL